MWHTTSGAFYKLWFPEKENESTVLIMYSALDCEVPIRQRTDITSMCLWQTTSVSQQNLPNWKLQFMSKLICILPALENEIEKPRGSKVKTLYIARGTMLPRGNHVFSLYQRPVLFYQTLSLPFATLSYRSFRTIPPNWPFLKNTSGQEGVWSKHLLPFKILTWFSLGLSNPHPTPAYQGKTSISTAGTSTSAYRLSLATMSRSNTGTGTVWEQDSEPSQQASQDTLSRTDEEDEESRSPHKNSAGGRVRAQGTWDTAWPREWCLGRISALLAFSSSDPLFIFIKKKKDLE